MTHGDNAVDAMPHRSCSLTPVKKIAFKDQKPQYRGILTPRTSYSGFQGERTTFGRPTDIIPSSKGADDLLSIEEFGLNSADQLCAEDDADEIR